MLNTMEKIFLLMMTFLYVSCAPPSKYNGQNQNPGAATIVQHENNIGYGKYNFAYQTSDGSFREEKAELKNAGAENEALVVEGSYTYLGTDGITYKVTYVADENGYRAVGEHLPRN